jgi:hypothetical protein
MMDIIIWLAQGAFMLFVIYFGYKALWISTIMLDERKARYRAGTHDYYDNPIEEEE